MKFLFLLFFLFFISCDFLSTDDQKIVGNLYIISPYSETNRRQLFVYVDGSGINDNIIEENVSNIQGDDSMLVVHCIHKGVHKFYSLKHNNGKKPLILDTISNKKYSQLVEAIKTKYKFP